MKIHIREDTPLSLTNSSRGNRILWFNENVDNGFAGLHDLANPKANRNIVVVGFYIIGPSGHTKPFKYGKLRATPPINGSQRFRQVSHFSSE